MIATIAATLIAGMGPGLSQAEVPPSKLRLVPAHRSVNVVRQCPSPGGEAFFSDAQAYRWDGSPMAAQRWNRAGDRTYWPTPDHRARVVFDGVTFRNYTDQPVLVAGWCEGSTR